MIFARIQQELSWNCKPITIPDSLAIIQIGKWQPRFLSQKNASIKMVICLIDVESL